ncbi:hypothetical protein MNB_SV-13-1241 [hydrothermal vent metagenome]|uniref:Periplasmic protein n=1 Tax=hydrothermal vent metagenome TaxID=652676 RepID=A0A1W1D1K9_9ZZZZ
MNRFFVYFLSFIIVFLSLIITLRFFVFSAMGNSTIKTYLQTSLKEDFSLPLKIYNFSLDEEEMKFSVNMNGQVHIDVITQYNMFTQYFAGTYTLRVDGLEYKGLSLRDANVSGRFKGRRGNMQIQGQGKVVDVNLVYRFYLKNSEFKHIELKLKGLNSSEIFAMLGEDTFFSTNIDVDIYLPKLGKDEAKGSGSILLHRALFDRNLLQEKYDIIVPEDTYVSGSMEMKLEGTRLDFYSTIESNLFHLSVENAFIDLDKKRLSASYIFDIKMLELLSKNTLAGVFKLKGNTFIDKETYQILGYSSSLGGLLGFEISEKPSLKIENIHLDKLLSTLKQAPYAEGLLSANIDYMESLDTGSYALAISNGIFLADNIDKNLGYQIPSINHFVFNTHGLLSKDAIALQATLESSIGDIRFEDALYNRKKKELESQYSLFLGNMGLILPNNKAVKRGYISSKGKLTLGNNMKIKGEAKGLGGNVEFIYDKNKMKIDAPQIFVEKILSLASVSRYVTGKVNTQVLLKDMHSFDGSFAFSSEKLRTQPRMIEKLIGKKVAIDMRLKSEGEVKDGNISLFMHLDNSFARLDLDKMQINKNKKYFSSPYLLDIPELKNAYALTGKKLYGPMQIKGNILYDDILKMNAREDRLLTGEIFGDLHYNLEEKMGEVNIHINNFHLNSNIFSKKLKFLTAKDPKSFSYKETTLKAYIIDELIYYIFEAEGLESSLKITQGILDRNKDTHTGTFIFTYKSYEVRGNITGTIANPQLSIDFSKMINKSIDKVMSSMLKVLKP